jgi:hypothetical protein
MDNRFETEAITDEGLTQQLTDLREILGSTTADVIFKLAVPVQELRIGDYQGDMRVYFVSFETQPGEDSPHDAIIAVDTRGGITRFVKAFRENKEGISVITPHKKNSGLATITHESPSIPDTNLQTVMQKELTLGKPIKPVKTFKAPTHASK